MKIYIKPPKKGVFAPQTKPCTQNGLDFSQKSTSTKSITNYFLIDYGKIVCTPWEIPLPEWDRINRRWPQYPVYNKAHRAYKPHWYYADYYTRKVPKK